MSRGKGDEATARRPETMAAIRAAMTAGQLLKLNYGSDHKVLFKDQHNVVTKPDNRAEDQIRSVLQGTFPAHSFFSEEEGLTRGTDPRTVWVVDPLDGTTNFAQHIPQFCVSIALLENRTPVIGVVYQPILDELFFAEKGYGAFLNGKRISVSNRTDMSRAVIFVNRGADKMQKLRYGSIFNELTKHVRTVRILGATAIDLCYLACGKFDAMVNNGCNFYDCVAGNLIASEAGARITDFAGAPRRDAWKDWVSNPSDILVTNKHLQPHFLKVLSGL